MKSIRESLLVLGATVGLASAANNTGCRSIPGDSAWPSTSDWNSLNQTLGGKLVATIPAGRVCHSGGSFDGHYDASTCAFLKPLWNFSLTHYPYPGEVSFPWAQACDPFTPKAVPCELGSYSSYSINVTGAADVVAGINWAKQKGVRIVIKNTGHDYLGKSTGKGGLSLWTNNLKTRRVTNHYESPHYTGPALKLGAGVLAVEAYEAANKAGLRVVGGTCATVGIAGGYSMGGGHSTLSSIYGLGADNVLEWEVVTAEGQHLVATPTNNTDLYWALSGGGGGTYAVVLSMTTRLHPDGPIGGAYITFNDTGVGNDAYWEAVGAFQAALPPILKQGISLLYDIRYNSFTMFSLTAPNMTTLQVITALQPILTDLDKRGIPFVFQAHSSSKFLEHFAQDLGPLPFGPFSSGQVTGSRLIPRSVVQEPSKNAQVTKAFRSTVKTGDFFIACQALDVSANRSVAANAVLPAWRAAASHCIVVGPWDYDAPRATMEAKEKTLTEVVTPMLEAATPGSGTYLNEANFQQKNFQKEFYGENYQRLLAVKKKYDLDSVFYATTAVGSEEWMVDGEGRLCKAQR